MNFYCKYKGEYKEITSITDSDISIADDELEKISAIGSPIEMTFTGEIVDKDGLNVVRKIVSGGDRGIYNGLTLREEGELTPKNAWL